MTSFIQITDTHIVAPGALVCGQSDTATALQQAVATINAKLPQLGDVDCAIVTGDLTDHGTPEEYAHFSALMDALDLPWRAVPGNHDRRDVMRSAFSDAPWMPGNGPIQWTHDVGPFCVIGLDTLLEGAHYGALSDEGFAFLDKALTAMGNQCAIVATHHPWMRTGIAAMDADMLQGGARLLERLQAHPGPVQMISGHAHRAMTCQIGRVHCQIAPAPCHAVALDHRAGQDAQMVLEPGAVTVHLWQGMDEGYLTSNILPIGSFPGPWPFHE
ncbi:phosphodiesterase [Roseovarius sp. D0-M9]|uniref:phosphodiesterase n=1 Tax=Roseovarius sp. D0-M9 TaxID=3127117 RepID=UPI00301056B6